MNKIKKIDYLIAGGLAGLYAVVTAATIGKWSIWFDEAFSAYLMRFNPIEIVKYTAADVHPPLYYLVLKVWTLLFGTSDAAMRSMSLVMIALAIVIAYLFLQSVAGRRVALWTGLLLALSPMLVRYGQEVRMYAMVVLISVVASWLLWSVTHRPTRAKWIWYGVLVSAGMWTHYFTALIWVAHWVWRASTVGNRKKGWRDLRRKLLTREWVYTYAFAVALYIPWLPFMIKQLGTVQLTGFWIRAIDIDTPNDFIAQTFLFLKHYEVVSWLAVMIWVIIGLCLYVSMKLKLDPDQRSLMKLIAILAIVPPVFLMIASLPPLRPSFVDRYLLASCFWLVVLVGAIAAMSYKTHRYASAVLFVLALTTVTIGIQNVYRVGNFNRESWETMAVRDVAEQIDARDGAKTPILADSAWRFYELIHYDLPDHPVYFLDTNPEYGSYNMLRDSEFRKIAPAVAKDYYQEMGIIWYVGMCRGETTKAPAGSEWNNLEMIEGPKTFGNSGTACAYKIQYAG